MTINSLILFLLGIGVAIGGGVLSVYAVLDRARDSAEKLLDKFILIK